MMVVLDNGFRQLTDRSVQQLLDSQMVALIAAAEPQPDGTILYPAVQAMLF